MLLRRRLVKHAPWLCVRWQCQTVGVGLRRAGVPLVNQWLRVSAHNAASHHRQLGVPCRSGSTTAVAETMPSGIGSAAGMQPRMDAQKTARAQTDDEQEQLIAEAERRLREVFGPQAKLLLHGVRQPATPQPRRRRTRAAGSQVEEDDNEGDTGRLADEDAEEATVRVTEGVAAPWCRASVTFRMLGFPIELVSVYSQDAQTAVDECLERAMSSDVEFIPPSTHYRQYDKATLPQPRHRSRVQPRLSPRQLELKAVMSEVRELCVQLSRSVKFAIKSSAQMHGAVPEAESTGGEVAAAAAGHAQDAAWYCRAYAKDEWAVVARSTLALERPGESPRAALFRCLSDLRDTLKAEVASNGVATAMAREVAALLRPQGKIVEVTWSAEGREDSDAVADVATCAGRAGRSTTVTTAITTREDEGGSGDGAACATTAIVRMPFSGLADAPLQYTAQIVVRDAKGNARRVQVRHQNSPLAACQTAALQVLRNEKLWHNKSGFGAPFRASRGQPPLLQQLRWQFDVMVYTLAQLLGKTTAVATVWVRGAGSASRKTESAVSCDAQQNVEAGTTGRGSAVCVLPNYDVLTPETLVPLLFLAVVNVDGAEVWRATGAGRYRLELDAYAHALRQLWTSYADVLAIGTVGGWPAPLPFPSVAALEQALARHDSFAIINHHKGNWNCYSLLNTLTVYLIGAAYQQHSAYDSVSDSWRTTLTVQDGEASEQILIQRSAKKRGEAYRMACLEALRHNFGAAYAMVLRRHPDLDLSNDTMAMSRKYRGLPREKRIAHIADLFSLISAFAGDDLGWHELRIRLRNASSDLGLPQWIAEMEAQVEGEEGRRVVAVSAAHTQMKLARRSLLYQTAKHYFPKEFAVYAALKRTDAVDPDKDARLRLPQIYQVGASSFLEQLFALLARQHPSMAPFSWTLRRHYAFTHPDDATRDGADAADEERQQLLETIDCDDAAELCAEDDDGDEVDGAANTSPARLLRGPLRMCYKAQVLGNHGDLLIAEHLGGHDESAVVVLMTALRAASGHLGGADVETLWTEFETHPMPPFSHVREFVTYLFAAFFGLTPQYGVSEEVAAIAAATANASASAVVTAGDGAGRYGSPLEVVSTLVGEYWFSTVLLRRVARLPVARAIGGTKRNSTLDALKLAARVSFPRLLRYRMQHDLAVAAFASDVMTDNLITQLPEETTRDLQAQLARQRRRVQVPRPLTLLLRCMRRDFQGQRRLRLVRTQQVGGDYECRFYLQQVGALVGQGNTQLVGYGAAMTPSQALHQSAVAALENLFEDDLHDAERCVPHYRDFAPCARPAA